ncbi:MAG: cobalamin-dependent protein [Bdellovibrionales bacterium]|nr:cobalamin-dependent protein [Bdellovibrionales bacterium]
MGGIQCLSAFLRKHGHVTQLFNDPRLFDNPWMQFKRFSRLFEKFSISEGLLEIERKKPDLIAFSAVSDDYEWALNWSKHIKSVFDIPIVFGNCHPTIFPEKYCEFFC